MSTVTLNKTFENDGLSLEIFVEYDPKEYSVQEIKSVFIDSPVGKIPVGDLFFDVPELDVAINKIVDRTDWHEVYREMQEDFWAAA